MAASENEFIRRIKVSVKQYYIRCFY